MLSTRYFYPFLTPTATELNGKQKWVQTDKISSVGFLLGIVSLLILSSL